MICFAGYYNGAEAFRRVLRTLIVNYQSNKESKCDLPCCDAAEMLGQKAIEVASVDERR